MLGAGKQKEIARLHIISIFSNNALEEKNIFSRMTLADVYLLILSPPTPRVVEDSIVLNGA
jgi:hypothetical protein